MRPTARPEVQLLLSCARLTLSAEDEGRISAGLEGPPNWRRLLEVADRHRLTPLLAYHLGRPGLREHVPGEVTDTLRAAHQFNARRNLRGRFELRTVLRAFAEHGIPCLVLKGAALLETVYPDLALRYLGDLDLMVQEQDLERSYAVVRELGYRSYVRPEKERRQKARDRHYPRLLSADDGLSIELHRHILRRESPLYFDVQPLWRRARETTVVGQPAFVLAPEDLLAHLCLHLFTDARLHYPSRGALTKLVDISETIRSGQTTLDWARFVGSVSGWRLQRVTCCVLLTVQRLLGTSPPESVLQELGSARLDPVMLNLYIERRLLRETPWPFYELVVPNERGRWNELKSACRRLLWHPWPLLEVHQAMGRSSAELVLFHISQVLLALGHYAVAPARLSRDFRVYDWLNEIERRSG